MIIATHKRTKEVRNLTNESDVTIGSYSSNRAWIVSFTKGHGDVEFEPELRMKADTLAAKAYQMFEPIPNRPVFDKEELFPMYSYERPTDNFYRGVAYRLFEKGFTEEEIKEVLTSKQIRWMLDAESDLIMQLGYKMAEGLEKEE